MERPQVVDEGDSCPTWMVATNILSKLSRTADKGWSSSLLQNVTKVLGGMVTVRGKLKCFWKNQPEYHFVHHKSHVSCPVTETGRRR
jgi:hypothetical protein